MLTKFRQQGPPKKVSFTTARARSRRSYWVQINDFKTYHRWASVFAEIHNKTSITVNTDNVAALRLDLPRSLIDAKSPLKLKINLEKLTITPQSTRQYRRVDLIDTDGHWVAGPAPQKKKRKLLLKRPGLSGPIQDIYFDPIVVVYGTRGGQVRQLRSLAKKLSQYGKHVSLSYPIIPDRKFNRSRARGRSVILVGNEDTNLALARMAKHLPIRVTDKQITIGQRQIRGENTGAVFIYPNPESPSWYVMIVAGTTARSFELFEDLPAYLPDYAIFDEAIAAPRQKKILGKHRSFVAAGYFDRNWRLPAETIR